MNRVVLYPHPALIDIMGSDVHLAKTVMNLATNGTEAIPGGGELTISTRNRYVDRAFQDDDIEEGNDVLVPGRDRGRW